MPKAILIDNRDVTNRLSHVSHVSYIQDILKRYVIELPEANYKGSIWNYAE